MSYTSEEARSSLLDTVAGAIDQLAHALASLGEAYEELDEQTAERLEQHLFRPVQGAYGRLRRAQAEFADRYGLPARSFGSASPGMHTGDPRRYIERAIEATQQADQAIADLQDSLLPVEVGDQQLREALSGAREEISPVGLRGMELLRVLGR